MCIDSRKQTMAVTASCYHTSIVRANAWEGHYSFLLSQQGPIGLAGCPRGLCLERRLCQSWPPGETQVHQREPDRAEAAAYRVLVGVIAELWAVLGWLNRCQDHLQTPGRE